MNFLTSQQEVAAQLGLDNSVSNQNTLIKRWLNTSQQMIAQAADWPFLRASRPLIIQTVPDYSSGTATVSASSASVTISSPIAVSKQDQFIQFADATNWYRIGSHTAGTASLTINPAAIRDNTAAAYTIRKFHYSLDSTVDRILSIRQSITPFDLTEMTAEKFYLWEPNPRSIGNPRLYFMLGKDSSDVWQIGLWPIPDSVLNLYVDYIEAVTDLSADADISPIPAKWHTSVLLKGALWQGKQFIGDPMAPDIRNEFLIGIEDMKRQMQVSKTLHRVVRPVDDPSPQNASPLGGNFPAIYPWVI